MQKYNIIFMASKLLVKISECKQAELLIVIAMLFRQVSPFKKASC